MSVLDYHEEKELSNIITILPKKNSNVIILDLGSSMFRAGPSSSPHPLISLVPKIYRPQSQKHFSITNPTPNQKVTQRTPWDAVNSPIRLISNYGCLYVLLEEIFKNLPPINENTSLVITEALGQPPSIRREIFRILQNSFKIPRIHFGIDMMFSFYKHSKSSNCLLLNFGHSSIEIVILLNGIIIKDASRRIEWGEEDASNFLLSLLLLKYPKFPHKITSSIAKNLLKQHCYVSPMPYDKEVEKITSLNQTIQFPYFAESPQEKEIRLKAFEDLNAKRRAQGELLRERIRKEREEKTKRKKIQIQKMKELLESVSSGSPSSPSPSSSSSKSDDTENITSDDDDNEDEKEKILLKFGYQSRWELESALQEEENSLLKLEGKELPKEDIDFSLLERDDCELDPSLIRRKRMLRLQRSGIDARLKKEEERKRKFEIEDRIRKENELLFKENPTKWRENLLMERRLLMKDLEDVERRRRSLQDRKSHSSTSRLKNAMALIGGTGNSSEDSDSEPTKKSKKTKKTKKDKKNKKVDSIKRDFGDNEDDWLVYRRDDDLIDGGDVLGDFAPTGPEGSIMTLEEVWQARVDEIETELMENVGEWWEKVRKEEWMHGRSFLDIIRDPFGHISPFALLEDLPKFEGRIELNVERIRVWEPIFQPMAICGIEQNGLIETISNILDLPILKNSIPELLGNVLMVGGNSSLKGLKNRIKDELRPLFNEKIDISINNTESIDPWLDSWRGASFYAEKEKDLVPYCTTEEEVFKMGIL